MQQNAGPVLRVKDRQFHTTNNHDPSLYREMKATIKETIVVSQWVVLDAALAVHYLSHENLEHFTRNLPAERYQ